MKALGRYDGALNYIYARWPTYLFLYGGGAVTAVLLMVVSAEMGWYSFVPLSLAFLLALVYFFGASIWAAHALYGRDQLLDYDVLFELSQLESSDTFLHVSLGLRQTAVGLSRYLTTGRIIVVDVYNPQLTPSRTLARWRIHHRRPFYDPRLIWRDGRLNLLPVPDNSMPAVMMSQTAVEFWQHGDRLCLLREIYRVLIPGGRLLLSERVRTQTNWLVMGPGAFYLPAAVYWRDLLEEAGFNVKKEQDLQGLIHCFRADKPLADRARQLILDF